MSILRPGGIELTRYAMERASARRGQSLLDVGCGDGTAAQWLQSELGLEVSAVDRDAGSVARAKEKGVDAREMDAAALDFPSRSFDIVTMECVLSVLERQEEALHEAYCVLRPGGYLVISDLYRRAPELERWQDDYRRILATCRAPRDHGDCETNELLPPSLSQDGALVMDGVWNILDELELERVLFEDRTGDLKQFMGQAIMDCGGVEEFFREQGCASGCSCKAKDAGYFLLIARKKDA